MGSPLKKVKRVAETRLSESLCATKKPPVRNADILADAAEHTFLSACSVTAPTAPRPECVLAPLRGARQAWAVPSPSPPAPTRGNVQRENW